MSQFNGGERSTAAAKGFGEIIVRENLNGESNLRKSVENEAAVLLGLLQKSNLMFDY